MAEKIYSTHYKIIQIKKGKKPMVTEDRVTHFLSASILYMDGKYIFQYN